MRVRSAERRGLNDRRHARSAKRVSNSAKRARRRKHARSAKRVSNNGKRVRRRKPARSAKCAQMCVVRLSAQRAYKIGVEIEAGQLELTANFVEMLPSAQIALLRIDKGAMERFQTDRVPIGLRRTGATIGNAEADLPAIATMIGIVGPAPIGMARFVVPIAIAMAHRVEIGTAAMAMTAAGIEAMAGGVSSSTGVIIALRSG